MVRTVEEKYLEFVRETVLYGLLPRYGGADRERYMTKAST